MYKVEQEFIYGWDHAPWSENLFNSPEEAQAEIDQLIADVKVAVAAGDMIEEYDPEEYRVVKIRRPSDAFNDEELVTILEAARIALADADMADCIVSSMDLDDGTFCDIRDRLCRIMGPTVEVEHL